MGEANAELIEMSLVDIENASTRQNRPDSRQHNPLLVNQAVLPVLT